MLDTLDKTTMAGQLWQDSGLQDHDDKAALEQAAVRLASASGLLRLPVPGHAADAAGTCPRQQSSPCPSSLMSRNDVKLVLHFS